KSSHKGIVGSNMAAASFGHVIKKGNHRLRPRFPVYAPGDPNPLPSRRRKKKEETQAMAAPPVRQRATYPLLHPLHAILLAFPIALFSAALATDITYLNSAEI